MLTHENARIYIRNMRTRMSTRGILLYPVEHLPLLSPEYKYESCEVSEHQNRASINAFHYVRSPTPFIIDISPAWIHVANIMYINKKSKSFFLKCMKYHNTTNTHYPLTSNLSSSLASVLSSKIPNFIVFSYQTRRIHVGYT